MLTCPACKSQEIWKHGKKKGVQRYRCKKCGKTFMNSDRPPHRPLEGDRPLTNAERQKRYRKKHKKRP